MIVTCTRKRMKEQQARLVAMRLGMAKGIQHYPEYCQQCRAYHVTQGK